MLLYGKYTQNKGQPAYAVDNSATYIESVGCFLLLI
jgi:hypothetical protein